MLLVLVRHCYCMSIFCNTYIISRTVIPTITPDKIILLTPDERLSKQHLDELENSGFTQYQLFDKSKSAPFKGTIEVIDINKLADEMGDKTVAVEAFEGNNLVLIDEGHKGTGSAAGALDAPS